MVSGLDFSNDPIPLHSWCRGCRGSLLDPAVFARHLLQCMGVAEPQHLQQAPLPASDGEMLQFPGHPRFSR